MRVVIDTCSLLALARYYMPFDKDLVLTNVVIQKLLRKEIIIIDKVYEECKRVAKGLVFDSMKFLSTRDLKKRARLPYDTSLLVAPDPRFLLERIDEVYARRDIIRQKNLTTSEYESQRTRFINGADMTQVVLCLKFMEDGIPITLVTEETESDNDNKPFKKLPFICRDLEIQKVTLPEYLMQTSGIDFIFRPAATNTTNINE